MDSQINNTPLESYSTIAGKPISVSPAQVHFGGLNPGETKTTTINITGGPGRIIVSNPKILVSPTNFGPDNTEVTIIISSNLAGEMILDNIILSTGTEKLDLPVTIWWNESESSPSIINDEQDISKEQGNEEENGKKVTEEPPIKINQRHINSPGAYIGRTCLWCGKNITYSSNTQSWLECANCKGAKIVISLIKRSMGGFGIAIKELLLGVVEIWNVITAKKTISK